MSDQQPDRSEPPAIRALWETLGAAQAGIQVRQDEARKDLEVADREREHLEQVKAKAIEDGDTDAYAAAQQQLEQLYEAERMLRSSIGEGDEAPQGGPEADAS